MTDLRREAEAVLGRIQRGYRGVDADVADIEAFAKAQRLKEVEAISKDFDKRFYVTDERLDRVRDFRVDEFYSWLTQRTEELKP